MIFFLSFFIESLDNSRGFCIISPGNPIECENDDYIKLNSTDFFNSPYPYPDEVIYLDIVNNASCPFFFNIENFGKRSVFFFGTEESLIVVNLSKSKILESLSFNNLFIIPQGELIDPTGLHYYHFSTLFMRQASFIITTTHYIKAYEINSDFYSLCGFDLIIVQNMNLDSSLPDYLPTRNIAIRIINSASHSVFLHSICKDVTFTISNHIEIQFVDVEATVIIQGEIDDVFLLDVTHSYSGVVLKVDMISHVLHPFLSSIKFSVSNGAVLELLEPLPQHVKNNYSIQIEMLERGILTLLSQFSRAFITIVSHSIINFCCQVHNISSIILMNPIEIYYNFEHNNTLLDVNRYFLINGYTNVFPSKRYSVSAGTMILKNQTSTHQLYKATYSVKDMILIENSNFNMDSLSISPTTIINYVYGFDSHYGLRIMTPVLNSLNFVSFSSKYMSVSDEMITPIINKTTSIICSPFLDCEFTNNDISTTGPIGFCKDASVLDFQCYRTWNETCYGFKVVGSPKLIYPKFCYVNSATRKCLDPDSIQISSTNISIINTYLSPLTKEIRIAFIDSIPYNDYFNFDSLDYPIGVSMISDPTLIGRIAHVNVGFSFNTKFRMKSLTLENISIDFVNTSSYVSIDFDYLNLSRGVKLSIQSRSFYSYSRVQNLEVSIDVLDSFPKNDVKVINVALGSGLIFIEYIDDGWTFSTETGEINLIRATSLSPKYIFFVLSTSTLSISQSVQTHSPKPLIINSRRLYTDNPHYLTVIVTQNWNEKRFDYSSLQIINGELICIKFYGTMIPVTADNANEIYLINMVKHSFSSSVRICSHEFSESSSIIRINEKNLTIVFSSIIIGNANIRFTCDEIDNAQESFLAEHLVLLPNTEPTISQLSIQSQTLVPTNTYVTFLDCDLQELTLQYPITVPHQRPYISLINQNGYANFPKNLNLVAIANVSNPDMYSSSFSYSLKVMEFIGYEELSDIRGMIQYGDSNVRTDSRMFIPYVKFEYKSFCLCFDYANSTEITQPTPSTSNKLSTATLFFVISLTLFSISLLYFILLYIKKTKKEDPTPFLALNALMEVNNE